MIITDKDNKVKQIAQYKVIKRLAKGGTSLVFHVKDSEAPYKEYALRVLTKNHNLKKIDNEVGMLRLLNDNKKILPIHKIKRVLNKYIFLQELASDLDLTYMLNHNYKFSEEEVFKVLRDILDVLKFIHERDIVHQDIKTDNILKHNGKYSLIDWSNAKKAKKIKTLHMHSDDSIIAPEVYKGEFSKEFDIYSLGCSLYYLITGKKIYGFNSSDSFVKMMYSHLYLDVDFPEYLSSKMKYIIYRMTDKDPNKRASLEEIEDILVSNKEYSFEEGLNTKILEEDEEQLYLRMAKDGVVYAQNSLGVFYNEEKKDSQKAKHWYEKASNSGFLKASCNLALLLYKEDDIKTALELFSKAANEGHNRAQFYLAYLYENGYGIEKNIDMAKTWYKKAAIGGYKQAYMRLENI